RRRRRHAARSRAAALRRRDERQQRARSARSADCAGGRRRRPPGGRTAHPLRQGHAAGQPAPVATLDARRAARSHRRQHGRARPALQAAFGGVARFSRQRDHLQQPFLTMTRRTRGTRSSFMRRLRDLRVHRVFVKKRCRDTEPKAGAAGLVFSRSTRALALALVLLALAFVAVARAAADAPLADAAKHKNWTAVRALLNENAPPDAPLGDRATALHWAAYWDNADIV